MVFGVHQGFIPVYLALMEVRDSTAYFPSFQWQAQARWGGAGTLLAGATAQCITQSGPGAIIPGLLGVGEPLIYGVTLPA